ncbi:hypothetical protein FDENT_4310 [Fusarium denticulatum]|uniref:Uncharacterized protein n=1 Tax=Fusarium denticulatum TaxID=48507 RepID=A0A8H5UIE1_9HYPO|nr:hypothetical protein FDENT_4310 [Fusarium denticulatum]
MIDLHLGRATAEASEHIIQAEPCIGLCKCGDVAGYFVSLKSNSEIAQTVKLLLILNISVIFNALEMTEYCPSDLLDVYLHLPRLVSPVPPFPGAEPDVKQRRDYVERHLSHNFPRENNPKARRVLHKYATIIAAKLLINGDIETTTASRFAWKVDKVFWGLWLITLPLNLKPDWPWPQPPSQKNGEPVSTVFASLREDHLRDGKLDTDRVFVPKELESQEVQAQNESMSIQAPASDGMHEPLPITPPTLESRTIAWEALYAGVAPRKVDRPFTLILPAEFDFWTFVYGPDGRDFNKIRERLMEERVELTWNYEERVHSSKSYRTNPEKPPEKGHALVLGPASLQGTDGSEISPEACKPINFEGISRIWLDILVWHREFTETRVTTLRSYLEDLSETRKARTVQGAGTLPGGFKDVLDEIKKERNVCKDVITKFLDKKKPELTTIVFISNWAIKGKEGNWLGIPERINLAGDLWRERAETPEEKLKISEMILGIKERAKSGLLRDYGLLMK